MFSACRHQTCGTHHCTVGCCPWLQPGTPALWQACMHATTGACQKPALPQGPWCVPHSRWMCEQRPTIKPVPQVAHPLQTDVIVVCRGQGCRAPEIYLHAQLLERRVEGSQVAAHARTCGLLGGVVARGSLHEVARGGVGVGGAVQVLAVGGQACGPNAAVLLLSQKSVLLMVRLELWTPAAGSAQ